MSNDKSDVMVTLTYDEMEAVMDVVYSAHFHALNDDLEMSAFNKMKAAVKHTDEQIRKRQR